MGLAPELHDVLSGRSLGALDDVELHTLAFRQRLEAAALDGRVVDEAVLLTVFGRNEPKALGVVEPLHCAGRTHLELLKKSCCDVGVPSCRTNRLHSLFMPRPRPNPGT